MRSTYVRSGWSCAKPSYPIQYAGYSRSNLAFSAVLLWGGCMGRCIDRLLDGWTRPRFQEVLHSALYSEAIIRIQPMLVHLTSAHEAGHVAAAYLTGLPVATYTLGE